MKIKLLLIYLVVLTSGVSYAQDDSTRISSNKKTERKARKKDRARYLHLGLGLTSYKLQDFSVSPLYYKGPLLTNTINYDVKGRNLAWGIFINNALGFIYSKKSKTKTTIVNPQVTSYYTRRIEKLTGEKIRTYLGGYMMTGGNFRYNTGFQNNATSFYDYITSYGITGKINSGFHFKEKKFNWNYQGEKKNRFISIEYQLFIPFHHLYLRPTYAVIPNFPSSEARHSPSIKGASWGTVARLTSQLDLTYFLRNNNAFRFSYKWDAYSINPGFNKEAVSSNSYVVSLLFRLNKKTLE